MLASSCLPVQASRRCASLAHPALQHQATTHRPVNQTPGRVPVRIRTASFVRSCLSPQAPLFSGASPARAPASHDKQPLLVQGAYLALMYRLSRGLQAISLLIVAFGRCPGISWCDDNTRADLALQALFPDVFPTTSRAKKYCRHHRVFVDGIRAKTTSSVNHGQHVMVRGHPNLS